MPIRGLHRRAGGRPRQHRRRAGARAGAGRRRDQRIGFVFGARAEVERIERYHRESAQARYDPPLFASRGLFATEIRLTRQGSSPHVRQASHHRHHRLVGRRHDLGDAHLRADLPPRGRQRRVHRGRQLSPLRPRRDEGGDGRRGQASGNHRLQPLRTGGEPASRSWRRCFATTAPPGTGGTANICTTRRRRRRTGRSPARSRPGRTCRPTPTCSSTKGLHGAIGDDEVNIAQHVDLLIGVVPVINLEWIQKLHRDKADARLFHRGGDRHDPAAHARLRALHLPAVHAHAHQFPARADGGHLESLHRAPHPDRRTRACS